LVGNEGTKNSIKFGWKLVGNSKHEKGLKELRHYFFRPPENEKAARYFFSGQSKDDLPPAHEKRFEK
jgi:hypothetical protein